MPFASTFTTKAPPSRQDIRLYPKQHHFVMSQAPFSAFIGGRGSGKTFSAAVKALLYAFENPGAEMLMCAPTYPTLRDTTRRAFLQLCPRNQIERYSQQENTVLLKNGTMIYFRSLDEPDSIRGYNVSYLQVDEAAFVSHEAWKLAKACVRLKGFPLLRVITSTPKGKKNWIYDEWVIKGGAKYLLVNARSTDNPHLPADFEEDLGYTGVFYRQEILGTFEIFEGLVYPTFTDHLLTTVPDELKFRRVKAGIDWGFRDPAVICVIGQDFNNNLWLADEWVVRGATIEDHIAAAKDMRETWKIRDFICDPSRPDCIELFNQAGLRAQKGQNDILAGISHLASFLPKAPGGPSRFFVDPKCVTAISEFEQYSYPSEPEVQRNKKNRTEKPLGFNDHTLDATRYATFSFSAKQERRIYY